MNHDQPDNNPAPVASNDYKFNDKTFDAIYKGCLRQKQTGKAPFGAEIIRRLLDHWALGYDPDPWLAFPDGIWSVKHSFTAVGILRYRWVTNGSSWKSTCTCGAYRYTVGFNAWIRSRLVHTICIGCNSYAGLGDGKTLDFFKQFEPIQMTFEPKLRNKKCDPKPSDVLKLLEFLDMKEHVRELIENDARQERQEIT